VSKKILIVDDDRSTLSLLQSFLGEKGFEVGTAQDGIEGLEKVRHWSPDLILLDVMMPKLDGYGFVREMKKDAQLRRIPIIVLTGREMMRDVFLQEGLKDYIVKPYDPEELFKILVQYF
jgi:CheY-like chemotaxis protein